MPRRPSKYVRKKIAVKKQRQIAKERLEVLAEQVSKSRDSETARKWVRLMIKISRRLKVPLPKSIQARSCSKCHRYWMPGKNFVIRVKKGKPVLICACKEEHPYKQKVFKA